ncbi:MAG: ribonuclease D [Bacteroidetes bacterium]|nr:MAG: ribonuclease D [Bacteroidota bacterium]
MSVLQTPTPSAVRTVSNVPQLNAMLPILADASTWAFDLEFDRDRYSYGFNLCLMQIATPEMVWIVDPIAIEDLQPLYRLFETATARKLCYSSGEDLRLLHSLQCFPSQLVDLEIYAKLLNHERTSLAAMLLGLLGIELDKSLQKVNWGKRPLSQAHLNYAAADVAHLFALDEAFQLQAQQQQLAPFVAEEMLHLNGFRHDMSPKTWFLKTSDERFLSPYQQQVLNQGLVWRDAMARKLNKPAFQIMPEEAMRNLILDDLEPDEFLNQPGLHPKVRLPSTLNGLYEALDRWHADATNQGWSKKKTAFELGATPQMRDQRAQQKTTIWQPIQQHLAKQYGEHTMRFLLSSTQIDALLNGKVVVGGLQPAYRKTLILDAARATGADLSAWM